MAAILLTIAAGLVVTRAAMLPRKPSLEQRESIYRSFPYIAMALVVASAFLGGNDARDEMMIGSLAVLAGATLIMKKQRRGSESEETS